MVSDTLGLPCFVIQGFFQQGSEPKGDEILSNTGENFHLYVSLFFLFLNINTIGDWMDGRLDFGHVRRNGQTESIPCDLKNFVPFESAAQKGMSVARSVILSIFDLVKAKFDLNFLF